MKIKVGTLSPVKVGAIKETILNYDFLNGSEIIPIKATSKVSDQPVTLKETIQGAKNRAKSAFANCDLSVGIESGIVPIPETKTGYMNISVCVFYDGKDYHVGLASGYECPQKVIDLIFNKNIEMSHAFKQAGLTENEKIGYAEGTVGFMTNGRVKSEEYYKQAIINALVHLENPELFK